jgi:hypothetical protein
VYRFALHGQSQNSHICSRCQRRPCRHPTLAAPNRAGSGYRPTELNVQPSTDRPEGFVPVASDRVRTLGVR